MQLNRVINVIKNSNKFISDESGNSILIVLFVFMCCSILAMTSIYITFSQFQFSIAYKNSSNVNFLAISGIKRAVLNLNNILNNKISEIVTSSLDNLDISNTNLIVYSGRIDGKYSIDENFLKKYIEQNIISYIDSLLYSGYRFSYEIEVEDFEYIVDVDVQKYLDNYIVNSKVTNMNTENSYIASAEIVLNSELNFENTIFENYRWKDNKIPDIFKNAVVSKGDIVLMGNSILNINGNVIVDGSKLGGIAVLDGSRLNLSENVYVNSNIYTKRKYKSLNSSSQIHIGKDAIAKNITVKDNFSINLNENPKPFDFNTMPIEHTIDIYGNAYIKEKLNIERYTLDCKIDVYNNAFCGAENLKSTGIFNQGYGNSKISVYKSAFVYGNAYMDFGLGFQKLNESIGKPYDNIYEFYNNENLYDAAHDYLQFNEDKGRIYIGDTANSIALGYISANGETFLKHSSNFNVVADLNRLNNFFNLGINKDKAFKDSRILSEIDISWNSEDLKSIFEGGIKKYIETKLNTVVDYKSLNNTQKADNLKSKTDVESENPIIIIDNSEDIVEIDISKLYAENRDLIWVIVDKRDLGILKLKASSSNIFNGLIYSNSTLEFSDSMTVNGIVIVGNRYKYDIDSADIENGIYSGIVIDRGVEVNIKYCDNILNFNTEKYMLKRYLYDYLGITDYLSIESNRNSKPESFLKDLELSSNSSIIVKFDLSSLKFTLKNLRSVDE